MYTGVAHPATAGRSFADRSGGRDMGVLLPMQMSRRADIQASLDITECHCFHLTFHPFRRKK